MRTIAHNTVIVNGQDQKREGRSGSLHLFDAASRVKLAAVSSRAYDIDTYSRLCILIDHRNIGSYLVDCFQVKGGNTHEYLFHGPVAESLLHGLELQPTDTEWHDLKEIAGARAETPWSIAFDLGRHRFTAYALPDGQEEVLIGNGWGERGTGSRDNIQTGETVPYVIRRRTGDPACSTFLSLLDVSLRSRPLIWDVQRLMPRTGTGVGLYVTNEAGADVIAICPEGRSAVFETPEGDLETNGHISVFSLTPDGALDFAYLLGGTHAALHPHAIELKDPIFEGNILETHTDNNQSFYRIEPANLSVELVGHTFFVQGGAYNTGYPILQIRPEGNTTCVYTKQNGLGYDAIDAKTWKIVRSASLDN